MDYIDQLRDYFGEAIGISHSAKLFINIISDIAHEMDYYLTTELLSFDIGMFEMHELSCGDYINQIIQVLTWYCEIVIQISDIKEIEILLNRTSDLSGLLTFFDHFLQFKKQFNLKCKQLCPTLNNVFQNENVHNEDSYKKDYHSLVNLWTEKCEYGIEHCKEQLSGSPYSLTYLENITENDVIRVFSEFKDIEISPLSLKIGNRVDCEANSPVFRGSYNNKIQVAVKRIRSLNKTLLGHLYREIKAAIFFSKERTSIKFIGMTLCQPFYIVTEFQPRGSLVDRIQMHSVDPLTPTKKTIIALGIAHAVETMHKNHYIHRDLKTDNILIDENDYPILADYGCTCEYDPSNLTLSGNTGTFAFMAPEVMIPGTYKSHKIIYNEKCDVYSYSCIIWELMTSVAPWAGHNQIAVIRNVSQNNGRLHIPPGCSEDMKELFNRCFDANPSNRPSMAEIRENILNGLYVFQGTDMKTVLSYWSSITGTVPVHQSEMSAPRNFEDAFAKFDQCPLAPLLFFREETKHKVNQDEYQKVVDQKLIPLLEYSDDPKLTEYTYDVLTNLAATCSGLYMTKTRAPNARYSQVRKFAAAKPCIYSLQFFFKLHSTLPISPELLGQLISFLLSSNFNERLQCLEYCIDIVNGNEAYPQIMIDNVLFNIMKDSSTEAKVLAIKLLNKIIDSPHANDALFDKMLAPLFNSLPDGYSVLKKLIEKSGRESITIQEQTAIKNALINAESTKTALQAIFCLLSHWATNFEYLIPLFVENLNNHTALAMLCLSRSIKGPTKHDDKIITKVSDLMKDLPMAPIALSLAAVMAYTHYDNAVKMIDCGIAENAVKSLMGVGKCREFLTVLASQCPTTPCLMPALDHFMQKPEESLSFLAHIALNPQAAITLAKQIGCLTSLLTVPVHANHVVEIILRIVAFDAAVTAIPHPSDVVNQLLQVQTCFNHIIQIVDRLVGFNKCQIDAKTVIRDLEAFSKQSDIVNQDKIVLTRLMWRMRRMI